MITINATITSAEVRLDREVFLSAWLMLDYGGSGQGFGGFVLGGLPMCAAGKHDQQTNIAAEFPVACMEAGGVEQFSELVGKNIRVKKDGEMGSILEIGHIVKDDKWFNRRIGLGRCVKKEARSENPATGDERGDGVGRI